jgi:hypothetical protein
MPIVGIKPALNINSFADTLDEYVAKLIDFIREGEGREWVERRGLLLISFSKKKKNFTVVDHISGKGRPSYENVCCNYFNLQ